jgi:uncharacterized protein (TIGR02265 family)
MKECFAHTDLEWRLAQIPNHAAGRGLFSNMLDDLAGNLSAETQRRYREFFQTYRFSSFKYYPIKDYLTRMVKLSEIHFGAENIYRGIYEVQAHAYPTWRETLLGTAAFAILGNDFDRVLRMVCRQIPKAVNYAQMRVLSHQNGLYVIEFQNEYVYIEHAMAGGLIGLGKICDVEVKLEVKLRDPFNGIVELSTS